ncbi:hypothetical protein N9P82_01140 [bacterium]|nr:hypothetical protein [bacterium]
MSHTDVHAGWYTGCVCFAFRRSTVYIGLKMHTFAGSVKGLTSQQMEVRHILI